MDYTHSIFDNVEGLVFRETNVTRKNRDLEPPRFEPVYLENVPSHISFPQAVPYSAVPYSAVPYSAVPYSAVPYSAVPYSAVPCSAVPCSAVPCSAGPGINISENKISLAPLNPSPAGNFHNANIIVSPYGTIISATHGTETSVKSVTCMPPLTGGVILENGAIGLQKEGITNDYLADAPPSLTPGTYSSADITVNQKGLLVSAKNGSVVKRIDVGPSLVKQQTGNGIFTLEISEDYLNSLISDAVGKAVQKEMQKIIESLNLSSE